MKDFNAFESAASVSFKDKALLRQAFTHRSYLNEHKATGLEHNERLEFLGDAVLELIVTEYLYSKYPNYDEGAMTSLRAAVVNANTLSDVAGQLRMNDYLLLSRGEAKDTGRARSYILANAFEAFVGALFLDQGYLAVQKFVAENLFDRLGQIAKEGLWMDAKSKFQEEAQERAGITPSYKTLREEGPDHDRTFVMGVYLGSTKIAEGEGKSKQDAEQAAARRALEAKHWN